MKCPICGGTAYAYACEDENGKMPIKCPWCGYSEVQTNEEWFDKLSTEEKAMVIICCCPYESDWFGDNFEKRIEQRIKDISKATYGYEHGVNKIKNWLKQPHMPKE